MRADERNDAAPHNCPDCNAPAYIGFGVAARCVQRGCIFYDAKLWSEWVMLIPDDGMPRDDEPDFFDLDEDAPTNPGFGAPLVWTSQGGRPIAVGGTPLDQYGQLIGVKRLPGESDDDYYDRLLMSYGKTP